MVGVAAPARTTTVASEFERFRTAFDTYAGGADGSPLIWWKVWHNFENCKLKPHAGA
jgi:hypothetical protein